MALNHFFFKRIDGNPGLHIDVPVDTLVIDVKKQIEVSRALGHAPPVTRGHVLDT